MICKRCGKVIKKYHVEEASYNGCLCRKCRAILDWRKNHPDEEKEDEDDG